jgi:DNA-binding Lrp family transcriptional regulator
MQRHPAVVATYYLAGRTDFLVHVAVRDTDQLRSLAVDHITARPEVANVETLLIFDHDARPQLPCYVDDASRS